MSAAFDPLSRVTFTFDRLETNPRFASIARPANAAILVRLRLDMEDRGGRLEMLLPYATIEPVRELLLQRFMGEKFGRDSIWESHLATELWATDEPVEAVLDEQVMSLRDVMKFEVGQTLMLGTGPKDEVNIRARDIPLMVGHMGRIGEKVSIRIEENFRRIRSSNP
jgi:flagellar motor switch protein FliM